MGWEPESASDPLLSPQEWWGLRKPPLRIPYCLLDSAGGIKLLSSAAAPSDQDLDQAAKIPVTQPPSSQGAHDVLQGAGQEGRESHPLSEAVFYKAEELDS